MLNSKTIERVSDVSNGLTRLVCLGLAAAHSLFPLRVDGAIKTVNINDLHILYKKGVRRERFVGGNTVGGIQKEVKNTKVPKSKRHVGGPIVCSCGYIHLIADNKR